jgi:uncharacterized membrane protein YfcA
MVDYWEYALLILGGFLGGFLNTVASSGSAVTLPALISFGLLPNIANATNRIPVFVGFLVSTYQFHKKKLIDWKKTLTLSIPLIVGTILGVLLIEHLPTGYVNTLIILALFVSFSLAIYKFKNFAIKNVSLPNKATITTYLLFLLLGLWGGIIVLDTATFILFSLLFHLGIDFIKANAMKSALCLIFSFVSLCLFAFDDDVNWFDGGWLAVGSFFGGYVGSKFASKESSRIWTFALLLTLLSLEILMLIIKSL